MPPRTRAERRRAFLEDHFPRETQAIREALAGALHGVGGILLREKLFRAHVVHDAAGDPVDGRLVYDPSRAGPIIAAARRGDRIADATLRAQAQEFRTRYRDLPTDLAGYLHATRRRGRRESAELNLAIVAAVATITARFPRYRPTPQNAKPGAPQRVSACSIVALVLQDLGHHITEKGVLRKWEARPRRARRAD